MVKMREVKGAGTVAWVRGNIKVILTNNNDKYT